MSRHRIRPVQHTRVVPLGLLACALALLLLMIPAAQAAPKTAHCAADGHTAKSSKSKSRKRKKRKATSACAPVAQPAAPTAPTSSAPPASSPAPTPPPATDPGSQTTDSSSGCGPAIQKSSGGYWQCTFFDNFDGSGLDSSKWIPQRTATSGYMSGPDACYVDDPSNISISNGTLKLTARKEATPFSCGDPSGNFTTQYTSGMVTTYDRFSQAYGRFEIRAKVPAAQVRGLQSSLWLWPADPAKYGAWPGSGEIDVAEMFSEYPDRAVPYIHYNAAGTDPNVTNTSCLISNLAAFHTYAVEWTPDSIKIIYDGHTCLVDIPNPAAPLTGDQPFDQPFIVALTQALGIGDNAFDPASTPLPATTEVDYVRVWK